VCIYIYMVFHMFFKRVCECWKVIVDEVFE